MRILIISLLALCLISSACATSSCRSFMPGDKGIMTKFITRNGTTDNVTFYTWDQPVLGAGFKITAGKSLPSEDVLPIENLTIVMYSSGSEVAREVTDSRGAAHFTLNSSGSFEFKGGDASMLINIEGDSGSFNSTVSPPPFNCSANSTNETGGANDSANGTGEAANSTMNTTKEDIVPAGKEPAAQAKKASSTGDYAEYALAVAAAAIVILILKRRKKQTGLRKKG
jgi:hypothetical protein